MISNEEMYDFASQIAGITDADLQQYKCGGKTKKKEEGGWFKTPNLKQKKQDLEIRIQHKQAVDSLTKEQKEHPERFDKNGNRKYNKADDKKTNEDWKPGK